MESGASNCDENLPEGAFGSGGPAQTDQLLPTMRLKPISFRRHSGPLSAVVGILALGIGGRASPIDWLFSQADAVIVGTVKDFKTQRYVDASGYLHEFATVVVSIGYGYKGDPGGDPVTVDVVPVGGSLSVVGINVGESVVLFVRNTGGHLEAIEAVLDVDYLRGEQLGKAGGGMAGLNSDLALGLEKADSESRMAALLVLESIDHITPAVRDRVQRVSAAAQGRELLASLSVLAKDSQPTAVARLASVAVGEPGLFESNPRFASLCSGAISLTSDPQSFDDLRKIAESHVQALHFGALMGLRRIRNPKAVPLLVRMLDDPDRINQYEAVISLVEITRKAGEQFGPSMPSFDKRPAYYIQNWKDWWDGEGRVQY